MKETLAGRAEELCIWAFPDDERIRRIAWFGHVEFPNRAMMRNQPSVLVYLSPVLEPLVRKDPDRPIHPDFVVSGPIAKWVSVATMSLLRIGDLWQGQRLFHRPALEFETFKALEVNPFTVKDVRAGAKLEDDNHLLPFSEHPWHSECTQSFCSRVTLPDGRLLVIPAMELIRFYFGASSKLLSTLFRTDLKRDLLYERVNMDDTTGYMVLDLAVGMPYASASDIARIAGNPNAWAAALYVGLSCLKGSVEQKVAFPAAKFPFRGRTDLQVHGQWLSRGTRARQIFIVNRIVSCSHPFPFQKLTFNLDGPSQGPKGGGRSSRGSASGRSGKPKKPGLVEQDASAQLAPHTYTFRRERRFPDLAGKFIGARRTLEAKGPSCAGSPSDPISSLALGSTGTSAKVREAVLVEDLPRTAIPEFLKPVVEALLQLQGVQVQLLTGDADQGYTLPVGLLFDEDGVIEDRLLIEEEGHSRPRQLAAFMVNKEGPGLILVFIESDPLYPLAYPSEGNAEEEAHTMMERAERDFLGMIRGTVTSDVAASGGEMRADTAVEVLHEWAVAQLSAGQ